MRGCLFVDRMERDNGSGDSGDSTDENDFGNREPGLFVRPLGFVNSIDETVAQPANNEQEDEKVQSSSLNMLPVFPDKLNWNEARERWVVWKPLFIRLLELRRSIKTQRDKETMLIARGGSLIQDIAFAQRPAPGEVTQVEQGEEIPVFENLLKRCDYYFTANSHVAIDIERFRSLKQKDDEPFTAFVNRLRRLASLCGFGADSEREIKMQMLSGAKDRKLLIQQGVMYDKSLGELETYGMRLEMSRDLFAGCEESSKPKEESKPDEVSAVREARRAWKPWDSGKKSNSGQSDRSSQFRNVRGYQGNRQPMFGRDSRGGSRDFRGEGNACSRCALTHKFGTCPAAGKKCALRWTGTFHSCLQSARANRSHRGSGPKGR